ncbi:hypothetical protein Tco_0073632 [Tanacetum coccineum]
MAFEIAGTTATLKLGDLSIDGYFQKIKSIVSVLNGLGSPLSNDDVVTFALEGLPFTYETISTVIYLHNGVHGKSTLLPLTLGSASSVPGVTRSDLDMLQSMLAKFGLNAPNISTPSLQSLLRFLSLLGFKVFRPNYLLASSYVSPSYCLVLLGCPYGMAGFSHRGFSIRRGHTAGGSDYQQKGVQTFWYTAGCYLVLGTYRPPIQFTTRVQQQQGGSFPGSVYLGQSPSMPFHPS